MNWPPLDAKLLTDAAETFNFRLGRPTPLAVTPDGAVLFRRTPARSFAADLFELDTKTGQVKTLLSANPGDEHLSDAEKARRERSRSATRGVLDIDVSDDGRLVFVPLGGVFELIDRTTSKRSTIDPGGDAFDPHLSPDGTHVAFVRDSDLWILETTGGAARRLTKHADGIEIGTADFAAQEELDRYRGFWWSPDSKQLVYQLTDVREVETIYVADARHPEKPPVPFKYPRAGTKNAKLSLARVGIDGKELGTLPWDNAEYEYLARVSWPANGPLSIVVLNREQTDLKLIAFDDANKPTELLHEHDDAWINVAGSDGFGVGHDGGTPLWTADGQAFWWMTEQRGDDWVLEKHDRSGKLLATETPKQLRGLVGLDDDKPIVDVASQDPLHSIITRGTWTSKDDGASFGDFDHGILIVYARLAKGGVRTYAVTKAGKEIDLPSVADDPPPTTTQIETVTLEGRTHYVAITRPHTFDPAKKYPVILRVYAGPGINVIEGSAMGPIRDPYAIDQWYADAGFIVVRSDGRGTPHRGRAWERAILKDLITVPLNDQIGALLAVGMKHKELDLARVGVTGWSFGGYFSAMAVMLRPDIFKAGIAGAPVTDWTLYDTAYTERYMREPRHNTDGYERSNVLAHAAKLERPLLLVHGITDDNVHFANALALIEALYVAGKRAEVITLSSTHMLPDPKLAFAREQQQVDFFRKHL